MFLILRLMIYRACLCLSHMSMWVLPWHFRLLTSFMLFPNLPHSLALYTKNGGWLVLLYPNIIYSYQLDQMFPRVIMHIPMLKDTTNMRTEFMTSYCMMRDDLWWCRMTQDDAHWRTMTEFNTRRECTTGDLLMNPSLFCITQSNYVLLSGDLIGTSSTAASWKACSWIVNRSHHCLSVLMYKSHCCDIAEKSVLANATEATYHREVLSNYAS